MQKPNILIVDGHWASTIYLTKQLSDFNIIGANDGRSALRKISNETPDLIILDDAMPGIDSYSLLSVIRRAPDSRLTPVIIMSSQSGTEEKIKSLEKGADDIITKPLNIPELQAKIKSLLRIKYLQDEMENSRNIVMGLFNTIAVKDPVCANHSRQTAYYAEAFAYKIFNSKIQSEHLKMAGFLHDLGSIGIKDSILTKSSNLEEQEYEAVKKHPELSEQICSAITAFKNILPIIRYHHERYDGNGYPDGLAGDAIPLEARVLAIADSFAALTSDRNYRKAYNLDEALAIIRKNEGPQWDPKLVSLFCELLENNRHLLNEAKIFAEQTYYTEVVKVYARDQVNL